MATKNKPASNKLLPMVLIAVLVLAAVVLLASRGDEPKQASGMTNIPQAPGAEADTPAETMNTLVSKVADLTTQIENLNRYNKELEDRNADLLSKNQADKAKLDASIAQTVEAQLAQERQKSGNALSVLQGKLDALTGQVTTLSTQPPTSNDADIPVGLGYGAGGVDNFDTNYTWVRPLGTPEPDDKQRKPRVNRARNQDGRSQRLFDSSFDPDSAGAAVGTAVGNARNELGSTINRDTVFRGRRQQGGDDDAAEPRYTIPVNATLVGSTAFTALVGRIPVQGNVSDPMPFKVLTGADNLAANGLTIPGLDGAVWSGIAIGDWNLGCVTGRLTSVTFVFQDGTIRTIGENKGGSGNRNGIGWISDSFGTPCVPGRKITNAPQFLAQRTLIGAIEAAGDAISSAETTTTVSDTGNVVSALTGDSTDFILGRSLSRGADEVSRWLLERQKQSFDAVFVRSGVTITINVDQQIPIDYELNGRKLHYASNQDPYRRPTLD